MPVPSDLVHQTSTSTGTGNFTLVAVNGKQSFNTAFGNGVTTEVFNYYISSRRAAEWERGTGHLSAASTLVRDRVLASSNSNAAVTFTAGTKDVTNDIPAVSQWRINVKEYGATGDGTTDDAAAINRALVAALAQGISTVFLPSGTYRIAATPVLMRAGVCLRGEGASSIIKQGNAANLDTLIDFSSFFGSGAFAHGASLEYLVADGNRANNTSQLSSGGTTRRIIYYAGANNVTINHCTVQNGAGYGIHGGTQTGLTVTNCTITNTEFHSIFNVYTPGNYDADCRISDNWMDNAILVSGINGVIITNNFIEGTLIGGVENPMTVNVSGTGVTWVSGPTFSSATTGLFLIADDGTVQAQIKTVNSSTSITLDTTMGVHTSKLAIIGSNDLLGAGGITRGVISGNIILSGASFGISLFGSSTKMFEDVIVSNNYMYRQGIIGLALLGDGGGGSGIGSQNVIISDNMVVNCCQGGRAGAPAAGGTPHSYCIIGNGAPMARIILSNNYAQDNGALTYTWLNATSGGVVLGQGNYQIGAQNDGVYGIADVNQPVAATNVTIGSSTGAMNYSYKFEATTGSDADLMHLVGPTFYATLGFFGTTTYWQAQGGHIEVGTATSHNAGIRTNGTVRLSAAAGGDVTVRPDIATPAAGSTSARLLLGSTSGFGIYYGSGAPTVSAAQGSLYVRSDGGANTRLYSNNNGTTGWSPMTG